MHINSLPIEKNIYYRGKDYGNFFLPETFAEIERYLNDLLQIDRLEQSKIWIDMMTDIALQTFYQANQFIDVREQHIEE